MPKAPSILLPTDKSAAQIRASYSRAVRQRSLFSARCTQAKFLERLQGVVDSMLAGETTEAEGRLELQRKLYELGYDPESGGFPGDATVPAATQGGLRDLSSDMRLKLILDTQQSMANNLARKAADAADPWALNQEPAWEFTRMGYSREPREWERRWMEAGQSVAWEGAIPDPMIALKSSPIWAALGEGAGGYTDSTGSDVPPFAYNSNMGWLDVSREEAIAYGLIAEDDLETLTFDGDLAEDEINAILDELGPEFEAELRAELEALA